MSGGVLTDDQHGQSTESVCRIIETGRALALIFQIFLTGHGHDVEVT
jgi:hypothetical protein